MSAHGTALERLRILGIGMGPQHVTPEVSDALRECDAVVVFDKSATDGAHAGHDRDEQMAVRCRIAAEHGVPVVLVPDPPRDRRGPSQSTGHEYRRAVVDWHGARTERILAGLRAEAPAARQVAILAWGDSSLFDSLVRLAGRIEQQTGCDWNVLPGVSAPQVLAARHRVVLHRVGEPVHVTTARKLFDDIAAGQRNLVVMLTLPHTLDDLAARPELDDWQLWWSANLGSAGEQSLSGRVREVIGDAKVARETARETDGWVMDMFLLRAPDEHGNVL
ncbi:SAM-dependent methyltransferase [Luteococcus sp. OSA5]|uniref:SAM-dependent methyltransferase n=1 Tax=Luteococcus sp. OSA5 TaxID=3401630 RepID=UPI003B42DDBA